MTTGHDASGEHGGGHEGDTAHAGGAHAAGGHGSDGHADDELGPVDWAAWTAGIVGVAVGLLTAACFALATAPIGH